MNANSPSLSIVIPSYRRVDCLMRCLRAVMAFAPLDTQIIVVDDGSLNATVSVCAGQFPGIEIVRHNVSKGFCIAANAGISRATGEIIELLNDDATPTAGWADSVLTRFQTDANLVAVAPLVLQGDGSNLSREQIRIDSAGDEYDPGGFARKRGHGQPLPRRGELLAEAGTVWGVSATAGFYRADALQRAGGFPPSFQAYFEDVDLSFRLRPLGIIGYEPASIVWHEVSGSYGRRPNRRVLARQSCNEERVWWRNTHGLNRLRLLPRHSVVVLAKAFRRWQEGQLVPWTIGRLSAIVVRDYP